MHMKTQMVKDLQDKDNVNSSFLIKISQVITDKNGKLYMNLVLMDKTGELEARIWDDIPRYSNQAMRDSIVQVEGRCQLYQGRKQLVIKSLQSLREDQVDLSDYLTAGQVPVEELYQKIVGFVGSMKDPFYKALAESILIQDAEIVDRLKRAPAAKSIHHAYPGGLIEHIVSIVGILDSLAAHYSGTLNRDLLFLGGFFHDIGKIWELQYDRTTDYTDEGRLLGHLVMGVELMEKKIRELEATPGRLPGPFPEENKLLVKHLIVAHHGKLEYGSPKTPHTLEALVVHYIDDLDSKVNQLDHFIRQDQNPGKWTVLNKAFGVFLHKPLEFRK